MDAENIVNIPHSIEHIIIDSRKIIFPKSSLFFALSGPRRDGHQYIAEAYEKGVRYFVVNRNIHSSLYPEAHFLVVRDVLTALQTLAATHRAQFDYPVIGITGSNGKTVVKEWLYQLLSPEFNIVRSPRSYNSQIGVPLSVWQMKPTHTLGIFEAGISTSKEMPLLTAIIQPTIGILTNIGEAHKEGFVDNKEKLLEKLQLFPLCQFLIYCEDHVAEYLDIDANKHTLFHDQLMLFSWGREYDYADVYITGEIYEGPNTIVSFLFQEEPHQIIVPFTDNASIDNCMTCLCVMLVLDIDLPTIQERLMQLRHLEMRLELNKAVNNCHVLNDSYSTDLSSLSLALDYLHQQAGNNPMTVILSDILQTGMHQTELYQFVATELEQRNVHQLIGIGEQITKHKSLFKSAVAKTSFYASTNVFLQQFARKPVPLHLFNREYILLKGARVFSFERINEWLVQKVHQTVLEINLTAMVHNLKQYQQCLKPQTKLMAMVKAFSYGSGSVEIARLMQFYKVDYLAVAYADEGVELRQGDIQLPIMVMNVDAAAFSVLLEHRLEPEIFSFPIYQAFHEYLLNQGVVHYPVHIKLNTGMNRLGFEPHEMEALGRHILQHNTMNIQTVFSHLVGSESAEHDAFTRHQAALFDEAVGILKQYISYPFITHIANSSGIFRHPYLQYQMVRLGIGLYGVDSALEADNPQFQLHTVATLKTTIAQIRKVAANETIGYSRRGKLTRESTIATLRIGYADGYSRKLGNGVGKVWIHGQLAPVVGSVCMDMMMVDITDIPSAKEGDTVELFGSNVQIKDVAVWAETIPYEIMTSISQRVKRVYVEE